MSRQGRDVDYGARSYYVETKKGPEGIRHGSGGMWSFGIPTDEDVWRAVGYQETTFAMGDQIVIDARSQLPNGNRWRYLGRFGESASYSDVDPETAKLLDKFLDGACLNPATRR